MSDDILYETPADATYPEPKSCPCECHKPKHEAQQPHANCMIGRK